ncbi:MAG: zinc ribbon domain-containing protein, partial [Chthonomonadales bacterium]
DDPEPQPPVSFVEKEPGLSRQVNAMSSPKATRMTMSGEEVEIDDSDSEQPSGVLHPSMYKDQSSKAQLSNLDKAVGSTGIETLNPSRITAQIGETKILATPKEEVMILSYCKQCGHQNPEGLKECEKCGVTLDIVAINSVKDIEQLPRAWGFDVMGIIWIILGFAAVYAGQFLIKYDPAHPGNTAADYLWTGFVVCGPGIFIFMRHYFCKLLFWVLTLASAMVWSVIGFIWIIGKLAVSDNMQVTLIWLAIFSGLSLFSWYTVRSNDAFDAGI